MRPRRKRRQERHWSGPGPQQPSSEHIRSHTIRSWAADGEREIRASSTQKHHPAIIDNTLLAACLCGQTSVCGPRSPPPPLKSIPAGALSPSSFPPSIEPQRINTPDRTRCSLHPVSDTRVPESVTPAGGGGPFVNSQAVNAGQRVEPNKEACARADQSISQTHTHRAH